MTINAERMSMWTAALRSGDFDQTIGTLVKEPDVPGGKLQMCCLGVGSKIMGLPMDVRTSANASDVLDREVKGFQCNLGESRWTNSLPPMEFLHWLGVLDDAQLAEAEARGCQTEDITIDFHHFEVFGDDQPVDGPDNGHAWIVDVYDTDWDTASGLNDCGFTFPQIADIIDYFGIKPSTRFGALTRTTPTLPVAG